MHKISASKSKEQAIEGVTHGLIKLHETVTWKAKHFGIWHKMKIQITEYEKPRFFVDEMIKGPFKSMKHVHEFEQRKGGTLITDKFEFSSPLGFLGKIVDRLFLKSYMTNFLIERNKVIKEFAESDQWNQVLVNEKKV